MLHIMKWILKYALLIGARIVKQRNSRLEWLEMLRFFEKPKLHKAFNNAGLRHINNFEKRWVLMKILIKLNNALTSRKRVNIYGDVPKWLKGPDSKSGRSVLPAQEFKSLHLRQTEPGRNLRSGSFYFQWMKSPVFMPASGIFFLSSVI